MMCRVDDAAVVSKAACFVKAPDVSGGAHPLNAV